MTLKLYASFGDSMKEAVEKCTTISKFLSIDIAYYINGLEIIIKGDDIIVFDQAIQKDVTTWFKETILK